MCPEGQKSQLTSAGTLVALFGGTTKFTAARAIHDNLGVAIFLITLCGNREKR